VEAASAEAEYLEQVEFTVTELTGEGGGGEGGRSDDLLTLEEISLVGQFRLHL
jgi:hypothetical protein